MTWSREEALKQRKNALRLLLDHTERRFTRSLQWFPQTQTDIPLGVWTLLYDEDLIDWYTPGGNYFRLKTAGWIESCRLLRAEVDLDERFGVLSAHLKRLTLGRTESWAETFTDAIAAETGLSDRWVSDAIEGKMAEIIYREHGAKLDSRGRGVEIPAHVGNPLP